MKIGRKIMAPEAKQLGIKRTGEITLLGQEMALYADTKGGNYVIWEKATRELLYEADDKLPEKRKEPAEEKAEIPDEAKMLKIFKNGTWKEFECADVRFFATTDYSNLPQFAWDFQNVEDSTEKYTKWSKTTIPQEGIIGSFTTAVMEEFEKQEILLDPKQLIGKKAKGWVADISFMKKGDQVRTKKMTITRFAALYEIEKVKLQKFM